MARPLDSAGDAPECCGHARSASRGWPPGIANWLRDSRSTLRLAFQSQLRLARVTALQVVDQLKERRRRPLERHAVGVDLQDLEVGASPTHPVLVGAIEAPDVVDRHRELARAP